MPRKTPEPSSKNAPGATLLVLEGSLEARARSFAAGLFSDGGREGSPRAADGLVRFTELLPRLFGTLLPSAGVHAQRNAARLAESLVLAPLRARMPDAHAAALRALGEAATEALGADDDFASDLVAGHLLLDGFGVLAGMPLLPRAPAGPVGCTTLVALPQLTAAGELLVGRNFDFVPLAGDIPPVLALHRPERGLSHISLHHAGGFVPGLSSVNEAGLVVSLHQNLSRATSTRGELALAVALELVESCASLDAAIDFLRRRKTASGWTFVIADSRAGRAAAVEIDAEGGATLFPPNDFLAVANCFRTRKRSLDTAFTGAWREHNWSRLSLLNDHARRGRGAFDVDHMIDALGDHRDAYAHEKRRALGNTVSNIHNLDAWVVAPGLDQLWIAIGHAPRSAALGYVGYRLSSLFQGRLEIVGERRVELDDGYRDALLAHRQGAHAVFTGHGDHDAALEAYETAAELDPDEPIHRFMVGTLLLKKGFAADAAEVFEGAVDDETSPYRRGLTALMWGRSLDVLGHRGRARDVFSKVAGLAEDSDPTLVKRARRERERGFQPAQVERLIIDSMMADIPN